MTQEEFAAEAQSLLDGKKHNNPTVNFVVEKYRQARIEFAHLSTEVAQAEQRVAQLREGASRAQGRIDGYHADLRQLLEVREEGYAGRNQKGRSERANHNQISDSKNLERAAS